jgi:L-ribulose-5-phosphate 3-epimerase
MSNTKWTIGVCSWSLQKGIDEVAQALKDMAIDHVHLAVGDALSGGQSEFISNVKQYPWTISATMIGFPQEDYSTLDTIKATGGVVPDDTWQASLDLFTKAAVVTKDLGVKYLSVHAGFIDHTDCKKYRISTLS